MPPPPMSSEGEARGGHYLTNNCQKKTKPRLKYIKNLALALIEYFRRGPVNTSRAKPQSPNTDYFDLPPPSLEKSCIRPCSWIWIRIRTVPDKMRKTSTKMMDHSDLILILRFLLKKCRYLEFEKQKTSLK